MQWILLQVKGRACCPRQSPIGNYALSVQLLGRGPKTIVHCDAMRTDPADRLCTGVDSQAIRATSPLACWSRTIFLCGAAHSDLATNTIPALFSFAFLFVAYGDSFDVRFFIYLHSATAAHNLLLLMQLIRRLVESPVLGTACLERPAAHSLRIHLPERCMDICIIRLDRACEAWREHRFHPNQCHPNEPRPPPRLRRSASCPPPRARLKKFPNETEWSGPGLAKNELNI